MAKRKAADGAGSIRQRPDGRWEARFTFTDDLGQKKRSSIYGDTQKEVRQKLTTILKAVDSNTYHEAKKYTVSEWLDEWLKTYCVDLKPMTITGYNQKINSYIKPRLGKIPLKALSNVQVQKFYNVLSAGDEKQKPLSPKSIQNVHGILHKSMEQAIAARVIALNPCDHVKLPKAKKAPLKPLMDDNITAFLKAIKGEKYETLYFLDLFSGLRQSEILGLSWDDIDMEAGLIHVCRQLQRNYSTKPASYIFLDETKNGKDRIAAIAPSVVKALRDQQRRQAEWRLAAGSAWSNPHNLVFTDELGNHLSHSAVYCRFKRIVASIGMPETRFHDLRHSYAINALQNGDSPKNVCDQLGHYSTAFTMDTYAATSNTMRKESQDRMEQYILTLAE